MVRVPGAWCQGPAPQHPGVLFSHPGWVGRPLCILPTPFREVAPCVQSGKPPRAQSLIRLGVSEWLGLTSPGGPGPGRARRRELPTPLHSQALRPGQRGDLPASPQSHPPDGWDRCSSALRCSLSSEQAPGPTVRVPGCLRGTADGKRPTGQHPVAILAVRVRSLAASQPVEGRTGSPAPPRVSTLDG